MDQLRSQCYSWSHKLQVIFFIYRYYSSSLVKNPASLKKYYKLHLTLGARVMVVLTFAQGKLPTMFWSRRHLVCEICDDTLTKWFTPIYDQRLDDVLKMIMSLRTPETCLHQVAQLSARSDSVTASILVLKQLFRSVQGGSPIHGAISSALSQSTPGYSRTRSAHAEKITHRRLIGIRWPVTAWPSGSQWYPCKPKGILRQQQPGSAGYIKK